MKLRLHGASLRMRLAPSDLSLRAEAGRVADTVSFPSGISFEYALEASPEVDRLTASYAHHAIIVYIPRSWIPGWLNAGRVGFEETLNLRGGDTLKVVVEKDLKCLHKPTEGDAFPHPLREEEDAEPE